MLGRSYDFCCTCLAHVKRGVALLFQVKGMLMISKHLGDLDICVPERSAKMQELPAVLVAQCVRC